MSNLIYLNYYPKIPTGKTYYFAGFDLDWTIIKTKSGNVFPKDKLDWDLLYPEVLSKLKEIAKDPNCLIITIKAITHKQKNQKTEARRTRTKGH